MFSWRSCSSSLCSQESKPPAPPCDSTRCRASPASSAIFRWCSTDGVSFAQVAEAIHSLAIPEFRASSLPTFSAAAKFQPGKFSLMIRVTFQSAQATLTDAQLADFSSRIVDGARTASLGAIFART